MTNTKTYWCIEKQMNGQAHWLTSKRNVWDSNIHKCMKFSSDKEACSFAFHQGIIGDYVVTEHMDINNAKCYDCQLPYDDFVCDFIIQHNLWNDVISPTKDEGGLLCPICTLKRLKAMGLPSVTVTVDLTMLLKSKI